MTNKHQSLFTPQKKQPLGVQFSHDLRLYFEMFYCIPKGTLTALPVIHASFLEVPHTW